MRAAKLPSLTVYDVSTRAPIRNEQAVAGKIGRNWVYFWVAKRVFVGVRTGDDPDILAANHPGDAFPRRRDR
jgi:hypothetical protein